MKHVKENDLAHGEFGKWLKSVRIDRTLATRLMRIAEEFTEAKYATSHNLGVEALYQIATLPPEERDVPHDLLTGETKKPEEMTVRELRELKRQLKQAEQIAEAERKERERIGL